MKYDFDKVIDRRGTDSIKWAVKDNELPMWVADMDFAVAPEILSALRNRVDHGVYGYTEPQDDWYESCIGFHLRRHDWKIEKEALLFSIGKLRKKLCFSQPESFPPSAAPSALSPPRAMRSSFSPRFITSSSIRS